MNVQTLSHKQLLKLKTDAEYDLENAERIAATAKTVLDRNVKQLRVKGCKGFLKRINFLLEN